MSEPHKMQSLPEFMASPDALTPQGMARRYADAAAAGVEIGATDNPFPGMSPEDIAHMDEFKAQVLRERSEQSEDRIGVATARIADARRTLGQMRHTALCSTFIDHAPEEECDCQRSAVLAWLDHIETPLIQHDPGELDDGYGEDNWDREVSI